MDIFDKIIKNEIPSQKVYEDAFVVAFLDINPVNPGHTLVVPKNHVEDILSASNEDLSRMIIVTKKVAKAIMKAFDYKGFNIEVNNGAIAGQVVNHLHFHIVPRRGDDGLTHWPGQQYKEGEMDDVADKIRDVLKTEGAINSVSGMEEQE